MSLLRDDWMKRMCRVSVFNIYCSTLKKQILPFVTTWVNMEDTVFKKSSSVCIFMRTLKMPWIEHGPAAARVGVLVAREMGEYNKNIWRERLRSMGSWGASCAPGASWSPNIHSLWSFSRSHSGKSSPSLIWDLVTRESIRPAFNSCCLVPRATSLTVWLLCWSTWRAESPPPRDGNPPDERWAVVSSYELRDRINPCLLHRGACTLFPRFP